MERQHPAHAPVSDKFWAGVEVSAVDEACQPGSFTCVRMGLSCPNAPLPIPHLLDIRAPALPAHGLRAAPPAPSSATGGSEGDPLA